MVRMNLSSYLSRIQFQGRATPSAETLFALHRAHLNAIAYENLDIHFGIPLTLDLEQIYDKIVRRKRGGWCFEMNGLFAWALAAIGFDVSLLAATVGRNAAASSLEGDHLVLVVQAERKFLADVGFGAGFLDPLPLEEDSFQQGPLNVNLYRKGRRWVFANDPLCGPGFDFLLEPTQLGSFAHRSAWLQTAPESGFVSKIVCHRVFSDRIISLRGAVLKTIDSGGLHHVVLESEHDFARVIKNDFALAVPEAIDLWPDIWCKHQAWLEENPTALVKETD